jgi:signal transduction histidine kinase
MGSAWGNGILHNFLQKIGEVGRETELIPRNHICKFLYTYHMEIQKTFTQIKNSLKEVQWRWIFGATFAVLSVTQIVMFFIISINVARSSAAGNTLGQEEILQLSDTLGDWIGPFVFLSLTFFAALWLAIKVRIAPRMHGLMIGVVLASISLISEVVLSPSLDWNEILFSGVLVIPVGWLGGYRGETILKNREAVYRTSQALKGADRAGILKAIGEQLAGPLVVLIALVDHDGNMDSASAWTSSPNRAIPESIPALQSTLEPVSSPQGATVLKGTQLPLADTGIHSLLVLPLSQVDETLVVGSRSRDGFSRNAIQNYLTIAEQVALSLENLKLLEQAHQMGIVQERQRLAAEIHDSLTQGFISIVTHLEVAEAKLEKHPEALRTDLQGLLNQARKTARENLTAARRMTWALRPDLQQVVPLAQSLAKLTDNWARANNIPVAFSASGDGPQLHPDIETAVVRTTREALNNIQKHAQATQVSVTLTYMDTLVALDVQDNGRGCDPASIAQRSSGSGFGLESIRGQVKQLGGELTIEGKPGKGCTVAIALPIVEQE